MLIHVSVKTKEDSISAFEHTLRDMVADARLIAGCMKYQRSPLTAHMLHDILH